MTGKNQPLYVTIANMIVKEILAGVISVGEQLLTIRKLSSKYKVTIRTIQNTVDYLESKNILVKLSTRGIFITDNIKLIEKYFVKNSFEHFDVFIDEIKNVMTKEEIMKQMEVRLNDSYSKHK